jgi:pSer/pThr/pTyr-binding forkhead associated (FHA) protein
MDASLKLLSGPLSDRPIPIARKLLIGRAEDCNLRLPSELVSGYHCVLLRDDFTLRIRDLASKNGTFVNGRRIGTSVVILLHEDTVSVGDFSFLVSLVQATSPLRPAETESNPGISPPELAGTGLFDGATLRAQLSTTRSPPPPPPVKMTVVSHDVSPSSD